MLGERRTERPGDDPAVATIEELLDRAATRHNAGDWRGRAAHVVTICACVTLKASPDWIIFDTEDGIGWRRWPDDLPDEQIIHAPLEAGGHADPPQVLAWLRGHAPDPWADGGDGSGDVEVLPALQRWLANL
ncbi:hypothetical protein [Aeromicrobium sp. 9AM]|uniref:hypothetical protein n=1 Tax=Aeromicrobium sp. 9AM TaxID=2653126 RepID=UPI0013567E5E|nr:hypothetical protein [Aeromicrobium sp. 9AM]